MKLKNTCVIEIKVRLQIDAPLDKVWHVVSKVDDDPQFWKNITYVKNTSKDRNIITREVVLGNDIKCSQRITLFQKEGIHVRWVKGVMTGIKDILLISLDKATLVEVQMNYKISGVAQLWYRKITKDLQKEAELALELIKEKAEEKSYNIPMQQRKSWADLIHGTN
ncbi:MAG: SRPBCC family protein [Nitrosopumilaceae archaeon]